MAYSDIKQLDDAYNKLAGVIILFFDNLVILFIDMIPISINHQYSN